MNATVFDAVESTPVTVNAFEAVASRGVVTEVVGREVCGVLEIVVVLVVGIVVVVIGMVGGALPIRIVKLLPELPVRNGKS